MKSTQFADRAEAGRQLAERLRGLDMDRPVVMAMPRGGVPVAFEVAIALQAPLDVIVVRKIGAPFQPELGVGAVAEGGEPVFDDGLLARLGLTRDDIAGTVEAERAELRRRVESYSGEAAPPALEGRTVIVVDDGLATGSSARAALRALRQRGAARLILAVPVAAPESLERLREDADEVIAVSTPFDFIAVGRWYRDFAQTSDEEVIELLDKARRRDGLPK